MLDYCDGLIFNEICFYTDYQFQLIAAFIIAAISAGAPGGFQWQAFFYLLVVIYAVFSGDQFIGFTVIYVFAVLLNSVFRAADKGTT